MTDRAVDMERAGRDIIHLGVGDPDFDTPQSIIDTAAEGMRKQRTHYAPVPGETDLRQEIAKLYSRRTGHDFDFGQVVIFPGAQAALFATMLCLSGPGDEVLLLEPFYATYEGVACGGGAEFITVPLSADSGYDLDIDRIARAVSDRTRVILANSPGNPTGTVFSRDGWVELADLCRNKNIWLISDEVYSDLTFEGEHFSPLGIAEARQNVVVVSSVSKSHAMTGWRLGWAIGPRALARHLDTLSQSMVFGVSQFTQDAITHALREPPSELEKIKATTRARRDALCEALEQVDGLVVHKPAGGMFVMVDVSALGCDGDEFANRLLDHSGVAVVPGSAFGDSAKNLVRIGYLTDISALNKAADKIKDFVGSLRT
ncbi:MAG: pyridoxal phosphate-dependent aminotransferase [Woeseiaceae bacterium]